MPYFHMMNSFPFTGFWMMIAWIVALAIAYLVYKDAEKRGMNGLLWGLPILIPWIGALFLVLYLIMRDGSRHLTGAEKEKTMPEDILNERYAKGELTRELYLQMKEDMGKLDKGAQT
jgi:putative membrane protein